MNTTKFYTEIAKHMEKYSRHKEMRACSVGDYEEFYFVTIKGDFGLFIPKKQFIFDIDKIAPQGLTNFTRIINRQEVAELAERYEIIIQNNKQIQKLHTADSKIECWINTDYLKYFTCPIIKIVSPTDPVFIYEFGQLAGLIMPVRMPK
jgi:hypothetical protein